MEFVIRDCLAPAVRLLVGVLGGILEDLEVLFWFCVMGVGWERKTTQGRLC